jgi:hypothetical protein
LLMLCLGFLRPHKSLCKSFALSRKACEEPPPCVVRELKGTAGTREDSPPRSRTAVFNAKILPSLSQTAGRSQVSTSQMHRRTLLLWRIRRRADRQHTLQYL